MSLQPWRRSALVVFLVLLIAGCGGQPTPQIVREDVPVTVIVEQTVEVTREVTRVVTVTPTPRPTATPTPAATPTPVVVVPAGWVTYTHPAGVFTVAVPPEARAASEEEDSVTFEWPGLRGAVIVVGESSGEVVGDQQSIQELVSNALAGINRLDTAKVIDQGFWATPVPGNFVELSVRDYVYEVTIYRFVLSVPATATSTILVVALQRDHRLTDQQKTEIGIIASTIHLSEDAP